MKKVCALTRRASRTTSLTLWEKQLGNTHKASKTGCDHSSRQFLRILNSTRQFLASAWQLTGRPSPESRRRLIAGHGIGGRPAGGCARCVAA